jgi:hypothetical protein
MNRVTNIALSGAVAVGAFALGLIVEKAFVHKGFMDELRKRLKRVTEESKEATGAVFPLTI